MNTLRVLSISFLCLWQGHEDVGPPDKITGRSGVVVVSLDRNEWDHMDRFEVMWDGEDASFNSDGEAQGETVRVPDSSPVVWSRNVHVDVSRRELRFGTRVTVHRSGWGPALLVEVQCMGPEDGMRIAQEEFVCEWWHSQVRVTKPVLSLSEEAVLGALGSASHLVRNSVSQALSEMGPKAIRLLVWGSRSKDAEVRHRSESLLKCLSWRSE